MSTRSLALACIGLFACGGDDDGGGDEAVDARPLAELTADDLLEMLLDVDGAGSGLDSDTVDGVDSADLARVTRRVIDIQPFSLDVDGDGVSTVPNLGITADSFVQFVVRVPPDAVADQPLDVHLVGITTGTPCGIVLSASGNLLEGGGNTLAGTIDGGGTVTISSNTYTTIKATIPPEEDGQLVPGAFLTIAITRNGTNVSDTCPEAFLVRGVAVEYQGL